MEELLLRRLFPGNKLNVVNEKDIDISIFVTEALRSVIPDRINEFIRKFLRGNLYDLAAGAMFQNIMSDRMH